MNDQKKENSIWRYIALTVIILFFLYTIDLGFINGSITEYTIQCSTDFSEGNGCYALGSPSTYRPNKNKQNVVSQDEYGIETLTKCTVINRTNWECTFNDGSGRFGFNKGKYFTDLWCDPEFWGEDEWLEKCGEFKHVPRWRYLLENWNII